MPEIYDSIGTHFNSFAKPDKMDGFRKYIDNLIAKSFGNHCYRYLQVEFPKIDGKTIYAVTVKNRSAEPVYITDESEKETFYIRRLASIVELKPSEMTKFIRDHSKSVD